MPAFLSSSMTTFMYGIVVVSSARHAQDVGLVLVERGDELLGVGVDAEVDDLEAGALEHHRDEVLADVVDVALDGADDDLADAARRRSPRAAGAGSPCPTFIALAASSTSGTNRMPSRKSMPTMRMPSTRASFSTRSGAPAAAQQDVRALRDLLRQAVVEVVVHLLGELVVVEAREVDVLEIVGRHPYSRPSVSCRPVCPCSTSWNRAV